MWACNRQDFLHLRKRDFFVVVVRLCKRNEICFASAGKKSENPDQFALPDIARYYAINMAA